MPQVGHLQTLLTPLFSRKKYFATSTPNGQLGQNATRNAFKSASASVVKKTSAENQA